MIAGAVLILAALSFYVRNRTEALQAEQFAEAVVPRLQEAAHRSGQTEPKEQVSSERADVDCAMTVVEMDGYGYIGYLSIPGQGLELPVMAEWDYPRLKISPCRYTGSVKTDNLVIAAHNYARHFGILTGLAQGDEVLFTDMDGKTYRYEVAEVVTLQPADIEEMISGEYPLTLFTCTYGGKSRVTVRCDRSA